MANRLKGKKALVTAAGQGMGRAAVLAFVREGATVVATDVNEKLLDQYKGKAGITAKRLDVLDDKAVAAFVKSTGAVDILFNCAGWVHQGSLLDCSIEDWDRSFSLNVRSQFVMCKAMIPLMIRKGGGAILNMSSVLGAAKAAPNRLAYASSKAAVQGFTRALAIDHVKQNIRVNCVCPGTVDTPSLEERIKALPDPVQARKDFVARQPMGRLGTVDDLVPIFVYLASDESLFASGNVFSIDGGMTI